MSDFNYDNPDITQLTRYVEINDQNSATDEQQNQTTLGRWYNNVSSSISNWMFCPSHLPNSNPSFSPSPSSSPLIVCLPESSSSTISISNNNQLECQKRMKELENQIAAQKAQTEAILAKRKEEKEKGKAEIQRQTTERQLKVKEENEKQQQLLQKQETERKMKAAEAEKQHQQKLKEIEERRLKDIQVMEAEMKLIERKKEDRKTKAEINKIKYQQQSETRMAAILQMKMELENELEKSKQKSEQESKEWEANFEARLKSVQNEYQKEIENRQRQEENQIQTLKIINEEDEQKLRALTKTLGELKTVVAEKAQEMKGIKLIPEDPKPNVYHPIIHVEDNKLIGSSSIIINEGPSNIGVIGLPKSGRSFLIGALAGGIWPKDLPTANPVITKNGKAIYKLNHPNNGFINGSIDENQPIYDQFFQSSNLPNLSLLILTIDGSVREEDYLILCLAKQYQIPTVIVRTKLDEWLDNLPKGQSKDGYVKADKEFVINSLKDLNMPFSKNHIFNISALAMIQICEDGPGNKMIKYQQDEKRLLERIHHQHNSIREVSSSDTKSDIVVLGLKNAGKSVIVNAIKKFEFLQNEIINEVSYDEMHSFNDIIKQIENADAKLYLIVIPNTVGSLDAKIASDLVQTNKNIVILLNKSDEIIDNLKKQGTFTSTESYIEKRHNAANFDLSKLNIKNIPIFSVSALRLDGTLDESYSTQEENFIDFLKQYLKHS